MGKRMKLTAERQLKYKEEGRGKGIGSDYTPWILVARSEISSTGLSTIVLHNGRQHHFLSNGELVCFLLATMLPGYVEVREQFPLSTIPNNHEVNIYYHHYGLFYPGTLDLAKSLGIDHPKVPRTSGGSAHFILSTDLLITLEINGKYELVAISYKPKLPSETRALELLSLEKAYWEARGVKWLLITYKLFGRAFANELMQFRIFALEEDAELDTSLVEQMASEILEGRFSYIDFLNQYISKGFTEDIVKKAFWSSYWYGVIPLKIEGRFNPRTPMRLMEPAEFLARNPIFTGSSSWI